ncbi:MAG: outer membrane protein [Desulfovibrio sp.]
MKLAPKHDHLKSISWFSCLCICLTILTAAPALAKDNLKGAPATWDKPYAGIALGYAFGKADPTVNTQSNAYFNAQDIRQLDPLGSRDLEAENFTGTLFGGFNHQIDNFVIGLEGDFTLGNFDKEYDTGDIEYASLPGRNFNIESKVSSYWMASIRPRVGYSFDNSLISLSAGPALSEFEYTWKFRDGLPESNELSKNNVKLGWAAGISYEQIISDGWGLKFDFLHYDFDNIVDASSSLSANPTDGFNHHLDYQTNEIRLGVFKTF